MPHRARRAVSDAMALIADINAGTINPATVTGKVIASEEALRRADSDMRCIGRSTSRIKIAQDALRTAYINYKARR